MRDEPIISVAPAGPIHWSGPIADDPRPGSTKTDAEQIDKVANGTRERPRTPSPSAQAFDVLLAAELDDLWRWGVGFVLLGPSVFDSGATTSGLPAAGDD
jgi:hypothetical protein